MQNAAGSVVRDGESNLPMRSAISSLSRLRDLIDLFTGAEEGRIGRQDAESWSMNAAGPGNYAIIIAFLSLLVQRSSCVLFIHCLYIKSTLTVNRYLHVNVKRTK